MSITLLVATRIWPSSLGGVSGRIVLPGPAFVCAAGSRCRVLWLLLISALEFALLVSWFGLCPYTVSTCWECGKRLYHLWPRETFVYGDVGLFKCEFSQSYVPIVSSTGLTINLPQLNPTIQWFSPQPFNQLSSNDTNFFYYCIFNHYDVRLIPSPDVVTWTYE